MKFTIKTPYQIVNKVYRKQKIEKSVFVSFKTELGLLLSKIDETESEEHVKNSLRDFLKNTFYKDYEINTKGRTDLVIHSGRTNKTPVAVIFETKKPGSKDFPNTEKPESLNCKALHEAVLYYLRERIENQNNEIKHIIITNVYEWFVFNAHDFERAFYADTNQGLSLKNDFKKWNSGQKTSKNTDFFYHEIAKPYIQASSIDLPCAYFDIRKVEENRYTALFKFLSATHLLKLPFKNDSNSLNKAFYNELLYIIGLEEIPENGRKIIDRKKESDRQFGMLLENIYIILKYEELTSKVKNIEQYGDEEETQLTNIALELSILWINRILFLKLLEAQLLKYHQNKPEYKFLTYKNLPTFGEVNKLFFRVLAKKTYERNGVVSPKFRNIPYLNSSLFEISALEDETIRISNLDSTLKLAPFEHTVVQDENGKTCKKPLPFLEYLFRFLNAYDFSSEGVEEVQEKSKTLINASVLGLIFEKINGYQDGSFFTPGFVTMYMSREAIRHAVIRKFTEKYDWHIDTFDDLKNYIANHQRTADILEFNQVVNSLKICDPAVGSGHFLVSALNEMMAIKSELGILADEKGVKLSGYAIQIENDELVVSFNYEQDLFVYQLHNGKISKEQQRIQKTLFHEKQTIIEHCLFGVDINANSVNICRLRLWIELLKNSYYEEIKTEHGTSLQLQTLPNIDINIKQGNSLLNRFQIDADLSKALKSLNYSFDAYKGFVNDYKNATNKDYKRGIIKIINQIKENFKAEISKSDPRRKKLNQLTSELMDLTNPRLQFAEPKDDEIKKKEKEKKAAIEKEIEQISADLEQDEKVFNLQNAYEWRFEFPEVLDESGNFIGFDIVMGNPPYGLYNKKQNQKIGLTTDKKVLETIKQNYPHALGGVVNAARFFYNLGFNLLNNSGINTMIVPFGILTDTTSKKLRRYIFDNHSLIKIEAFPERDNKRKRIFEEVKMSTAILFAEKKKAKKMFDIGISYERNINHEERLFLKYTDIEKINDDLLYIPITSKPEFEILTSIYSKPTIVKLGSISTCQTGEVDMTFGKPAISKNSKYKKLIKGVQIDKYILKEHQNQISQGNIEYLNSKKFEKIYKGQKLMHSKHERIALQGLTGINEKTRLKCTILPKGYYLANSANYLLPAHQIETKCLLALLNSKLINYVFKCKSTNSNVNGYEVDELPIIIPEKQQDYISLVDKIFEAKTKSLYADIEKYERQIDDLVFKLYEMKKEEVDTIKNK